MNICKDYLYATQIEDALAAMQSASGSVKLLAGGTDLLLDIRQGRHAPVDTLVDVTAIPALNLLEARGQEIFIGAAVPHCLITKSALIQEHAQALAEASGLIGGPQVRNVATLGGNVAHALPAADGTIALMALGARAEIATLQGSRQVPLESLFKGPGQSTLDPRKDLLVGFHIPQKKAHEGSAFQRVMRPQGVAIAILNCAVWVRQNGGIIEDVRLAVGPSGPVPKRLRKVEDALRGMRPGEEEIEKTIATLLVEASFRTSRHRATEAYRKEMAAVLLRETLQLACKRCE